MKYLALLVALLLASCTTWEQAAVDHMQPGAQPDRIVVLYGLDEMARKCGAAVGACGVKRLGVWTYYLIDDDFDACVHEFGHELWGPLHVVAP